MKPKYEQAVEWIVRNRGGAGGQRCELTVMKVSGWLTVKMVASLWSKRANMVAADVINVTRLTEIQEFVRQGFPR